MTDVRNGCPNCDGEGWVYEDDETMPLGDGTLPFGPGVVCPVCRGGITLADRLAELDNQAGRRPPRDAVDRANRVSELDDSQILYSIASLGDRRVINDRSWLPLLEAEARRRGLSVN